MMKALFAGLCAAGLLSLLALSTAVLAQTRTAEARPAEPYYNIANEVTLRGTVSRVLTRSSSGMIPGSHIFLATAAGTVDASLGRFGLRGRGALAVATGDQVEVTGVMTTRRGMQVLVVRTVKKSGHAYAMRNEHGIPAPPQARERAGRKNAQFGRGL